MSNSSTPTDYQVRLAPNTHSLLITHATQGYYLHRSQSSRGFSEFINVLALQPFLSKPDSSLIIRAPIGRPIYISLNQQSIDSFRQIACDNLLLPIFSADPIEAQSSMSDSDMVSLVLNNITTNYLSPSSWPTMFPQSIMEHLPVPSPPRIINTQYQTVVISEQAFSRLTQIMGTKPSQVSIFINEILSNPSLQYVDNRPPHLLTQSESNLALGLPPVWFDPLPQKHTMHLSLSPTTLTALTQQASQLGIVPRSSHYRKTPISPSHLSQKATVSALLEAIGQDTLRWN